MNHADVLRNEIKCINRKTEINCSDCANCDLVLPNHIILNALNHAIELLEKDGVCSHGT